MVVQAVPEGSCTSRSTLPLAEGEVVGSEEANPPKPCVASLSL